MKAYIDADILIWHLRGEKKAKKFLINLRDNKKYELYTGAMQRAEVVFFMRPEEEKPTELFLSQFRTEPVDQEIIDTGGRIYTLNTKHYPMAEINTLKAW